MQNINIHLHEIYDFLRLPFMEYLYWIWNIFVSAQKKQFQKILWYLFYYSFIHLFIIPHAMSCGGYNVFDPSVSQSVSPSVSPVFLLSATPLKRLNRISWNFVDMKDIMCRCAYPQEIWFHFFSRSNALFELRNLPKWKILLKTVC